MEAIALYLNQRSSLASNDISKFCTCGGKRYNSTQHNVNYSVKHAEIIDAQQKQLEVYYCESCTYCFRRFITKDHISIAPHTL